MRRSILWSVGTMLVMAVSAAAQAPAPLPMGAPAQGSVSSDSPSEFAVTAKSAGVLSVAVQGKGDLSLQLVDEDGQVLPNGSADRDLNGDEGTELLSATVSEPGSYRVRVRLQGGEKSAFTIAGSFLGFPAFQRPGDPDRRPGSAKLVTVGKAYEDGLDPEAGDSWDWFVLKAAEAGTLTVVTRQLGNADAPDLVLELYTQGKFTDAQDRSDQDLQSNAASESVTVQVAAGEAVHVRVTGNFTKAAKYRLSSSLAP
jgi:hypothetical protein